MSRERAERRALRESERAARIAAVERRDERRRRREATLARARGALPRRTRWRGQRGRLARRRQIQNTVIAGLFVTSQLIVWLLTSDWWVRAGAFVVAVLSLPVLVTLALDRRS